MRRVYPRSPGYALAIAIAAAAVLGRAQEFPPLFRLHVADETGAPRGAVCELAGKTDFVARRSVTDSEGVCAFHGLPAGSYRARVVSVGFRPAEMLVSIKSAARTDERVVLHVAGGSTTVEVTASPEDVEPGNAQRVGGADLERRTSSQPARALIDVVSQQPGWVLEANGVLHPRGSEYDTQYIVDGVPVLENRSPGFAPPLDLSEVDAIEVQTGGYPAAYGRKLGGVVEIRGKDHLAPGWHGAAESQFGSFGTQRMALQIGFASRASSIRVDASGMRTNRFLDPPTLENFNNEGDAEGGGVSFAHEFSPYKRLRVSARRAHSEFDVPNELAQQLAGQRQSRQVDDTSAQAWYQQVLSPSWLFDLHASARSLTAALDSNAASIPILPLQHRGLREFYGAASLAAHHGRHDISFGADFIHTALHESFQYSITDASAFDPGVLPAFAFAQHTAGNQAAWYVQDRISAGPLTVNAGLRGDFYGLLVRETAWSPRLAATLNVRPLGVVLRGSYDRVFNTPATENLLLASSTEAQQVTPANLGLPVRPAHANFYEVGASKSFAGELRLDVAAFRRDFRNFADDDVFLNTGLSFPIAFSFAQIEGIEASIHLRFADKFAADGNYSNLSGTARLPVTGGLFLEGGAGLLSSAMVFRITQDQRNTASARLRFDATKRVWAGVNGWYGSGLPVEIEEGIPHTGDPLILQRVNFDRGRLRPSFAAGITAGALVWKKEARTAELQFALDNITNHLNVINFAGLFSGTALGAPRAVNLKIRYAF